MRTERKVLPSWIQPSLQGITYWIGHRRCMYKKYPLSEGALVAEVCNLIHANIPKEYELLCEVRYCNFVTIDKRQTLLTNRSRVDLVVAEKAEKKPIPKFLIEVKRASAPRNLIDADLGRLSIVNQSRPDIRTFLFVISEAYRPSRFVDKDGKSISGRYKIPKSEGYFIVRHTWKAAPAFINRNHAQYGCLIEVYPPRGFESKQTKVNTTLR